ncbi:MAG: hypothetical protein NT166_27300 [Candidatus Aminicenantes bacterium]|nr:hypothetical protein [Candidatus Aminicenantes bacterium]
MMKKRTTHGYFLESTQLLFQNAQEDVQINTLLAPYEYGLSLCSRGYKSDSRQIKRRPPRFKLPRTIIKRKKENNRPTISQSL